MALSMEELKALANKLAQTVKEGEKAAREIEHLSPPPSPDSGNTISLFDAEAKKAGFLILASGEAYECQLTKYHSVFLFREGERWDCYRASWIPGRSMAHREKTFGRNLPFRTALDHAVQYIRWFQSRQR